MKKAFCFILLCTTFIMISGCSKNNSSSFASILIYNHQEFISSGEEYVPTGAHETLQMVGIVSQQFSNEQVPDPSSTYELIANELVVGTEIYLLDETTLQAKRKDNLFKVFKLHK